MEINKKASNWDTIVKSQNGHPLQLFGWGEVKSATKTWSVAHAIRADKLDGTVDFAQILIRKTPLGKFGYIPRGQNLNHEFLHELRAHAKRENLFMLRFEPNVPHEQWLNANSPRHNGARQREFEARFAYGDRPNRCRPRGIVFRHPHDHILLNRTVQLNLTKPSDTLLTEMDGTTRQNIRRGERNLALNIRPATAADLDAILKIYRETAERSNFPLHPDDYYRTIFAKMGDANHIFVAEIENSNPDNPTAPATSQVEAFLWCVKTPAICFELYGGASALALKHRANYLLKWQTILAAQSSGCKIYDINGLLNDGISDFKRGFSAHIDGHATETILAPTSDLVIRPFSYFLFATFLPLAKRFFSARRTSSNS